MILWYVDNSNYALCMVHIQKSMHYTLYCGIVFILIIVLKNRISHKWFTPDQPLI